MGSTCSNSRTSKKPSSTTTTSNKVSRAPSSQTTSNSPTTGWDPMDPTAVSSTSTSVLLVPKSVAHLAATRLPVADASLEATHGNSTCDAALAQSTLATSAPGAR